MAPSTIDPVSPLPQPLPQGAGRSVGDAGFTLLEVIVVIVVLGLMVGLVVQRGPSRSPTLDLRAAAEEVTRTLRLARTRAIATNRAVVFRLDVVGHAYAVDGAPPRSLPAALALGIVAIAPGAAGTPSISFAPDGSSSGGRIAMGEGARHIDIGVDWLTGRVSLGQMSVADAR